MNVTRNFSDRNDLSFDVPTGQRASLVSSHTLKPSVSGHVISGNIRSKKFLGNTTVIMSNEVSEPDEELQSWHDWIGHRVSISGVKFGILRYFGETEFSAGLWCGVELDEPVGKNNGVVKGVQYFTCEEKHGIFAPLAKTAKILDDKFLVEPKRTMKSKLPSPKVKQNLKSNPSKKEFHNTSLDFGKTVLPSYIPNVNTKEGNAVNDLFRKLRRQSEVIRGNAKFISSLPYQNLNSEIESCKLNDRKISLPLNICYSEDFHEDKSDFLNQTVTLGMNENFAASKSELDTTVSFSDGGVLNTTVEISSANNSRGLLDKHDNTFILDACNKNSLTEVHINEHFGSNEDILSVDFDESLGILSPSEMKDFTSSFESACVNVTEKQPGIPKNESCDDVNDLPEAEVISNDEMVAPLPLDVEFKNEIDVQNVSSNNNDDAKLLNNDLGRSASSNLVFSKFDHQKNFMPCEVDTNNKVQRFSFTHSHKVDEINNIVPFPNNMPSDLVKQKQSHSCMPPSTAEALNYLDFSAPLNAAEPHNTSFSATDTGKEHRVMSEWNNVVSGFLIDLATPKANSSKACLTDFSGEKISERALMPRTSHLNNLLKLSCSNQHNLSLNQHNTISQNFNSRLSFTPITDETMPNAMLSISDLDKEVRNSLGLLATSDFTEKQNISNCRDLINFSAESCATAMAPSLEHSVSPLFFNNNEQDPLVQNNKICDNKNNSFQNSECITSNLNENTAIVLVEKPTSETLEEVKLINLTVENESDCGVMSSVPDLASKQTPDCHVLFTSSDNQELQKGSTFSQTDTKTEVESANKFVPASPFNFEDKVIDEPNLLCYNVDNTVLNSGCLQTIQDPLKLDGDPNNLNLCSDSIVINPDKLVDISDSAAECNNKTEKLCSPLIKFQGRLSTFPNFQKNEAYKISNCNLNKTISIFSEENKVNNESNITSEISDVCNVLNETIDLRNYVIAAVDCLSSESTIVNQQLVTQQLNRTYSNGTLVNSMKSEREVQSEYPEKCIEDATSHEMEKTQTLCHQSSAVDLNGNCPDFLEKIEDISVISGDGTCFDLSDVFDNGESLSRMDCSLGKHEATFEIPSYSTVKPTLNKNKDDSGICHNTKSVKTIGSKPPTQLQNNEKPAKKSVVSKVKLMLEANKTPSPINQENVNVKNTTFVQKKASRWNAITSKIYSGITESKTPKAKKDIASRISSNLTRHSTPKGPKGCSTFRPNKTSGLESLAARDVKNIQKNQRVNNDKHNSGDESNYKRESRILTQLQNVESSSKLNDGFKVPICISKTKKSSSYLPSPTGSTNSASSVPSPVSSKAVMIPKKSGIKVPSNIVKSTKPDIHSSAQVVPQITRHSVGGKLKEAPKEEVRRNRRISTLPKLKPPRTSVFHR